jgi:hypothetical protein
MPPAAAEGRGAYGLGPGNLEVSTNLMREAG